MSVRDLRSILVATDLTPLSDDVMRQAASLAKQSGADLHVLHVVAGPPARAGAGEAVPAEELRTAEARLDAQVRDCLADVHPATRQVRTGVPHEEIAARRLETSAGLVVIGPHGGRGLRARILGTTADRVLRDAAVPCLVVRRAAPASWRHIAVPSDLSAPAADALAQALAWSERFATPEGAPAALSLVHVGWPVDRASDPRHSTRVRRALRRDAGRAAGSGRPIDVEVLWANQPVDALVRWARRQAVDLLVVPTSGLGGVRRAILGSTSSALARQAPCSVLLVPPSRPGEGRPARLEWVVIGADFSAPSDAAVEWTARHLAPDADFVLVHAIDVMEPPAFLDRGAATRAELVEGARDLATTRIRSLARRSGMRRPSVEIREGRAFDVLDAVVRERQADLVVVGEHTHPRGAPRVLGTTAERLVRSASSPVLVVRGAPPGPPRRILAAVDASAHASGVLAWAYHLADRLDAELAVCHVLSPMYLGRAHLVSGIAASRELEGKYRAQGEAWLREVLAARGPGGRTADARVMIGDPGYEILAAEARDAYDLIVLGNRGEGALARSLLGSVASRVLRSATCPVLVVTDGRG